MADAKRKKRFFEVDIPVINKSTFLLGYDVEELAGRQFTYDLTRVLRGKNALVSLKVKVKEGKAEANAIGLELVPSYIRRMVRKGTNYVEDSFSTEAKDSVVRIKPFLVTRRKVSREVRKALRNKAKEELAAYVKTKTAEAIVEELLHGSLQKTLSIKLKKVYPLSVCEIKTFKAEKFK
ncbi:30S ribosomal protein S3Ae [uncultured archaeon]|nr:30S ribosomal protein S3Ae [uncultured archaeon]